jgi:hypothetical protein
LFLLYESMVKYTTILLVFTTLLSLTTAFVLQPSASVERRSSYDVSFVTQYALADTIFGMDLFNPEINKYGARKKKGTIGPKKLTDNAYVPAGLSKTQYEKIRFEEAAK